MSANQITENEGKNMACHRCPHAADVAAGKFKTVPFEETPCCKCTGKSKSADYVLEYDEDRETSADPVVQVPFAAENALPDEPMVPRGIMLEVIHGLLSLSPAQLEVIQARLEHVPYKDIAARQGVTTSMAELSHKRAMNKWPPLRALFLEKSRKQSRRRKAGSGPKLVEPKVRHGAGWRSAGGGFERTTITPDFNDHDHRQDLCKKAS